MTAPRVDVSIAVYRGEPVDYRRYRHTSICFRFDDGNSPMIVNVTGAHGFFEFEARDNHDPSLSAQLAKEVPVGRFNVPITKAELVALASRTPPDNTSWEFNCQTWVEAVLKRFADEGYLKPDDYSRGIDGMVDVIMEAKDEPLD